jgi:DNA polymerase-1
MSTITIDFETSKAPRHLPWIPGSYPVCLGTNTGKFWLFNYPEMDICVPKIVQEIQEYLDQYTVLVAHNMKFELVWLRQLGICTQNHELYCTMVGEYILNGQDKNGYSLDKISQSYGLGGKMDLVGKFWDSDYETDEIPLSILKRYCQYDTELTSKIYTRQQSRISQNRQLLELVNMEMQTIRHLAEIEWNGMQVDRRRLDELGTDARRHLDSIDGRLRSLLNTDANFSSPEQVSAVLYGRTAGVGKNKGVQSTNGCEPANGTLNNTGLYDPKEVNAVPTKKTGVYVTDRDSLTQLPTPTKLHKEVISLLLDRANTKKQLTTYYEGMSEMVVNGRVHGSMMQTVTATGRLSSRKPNIQNLSRGSTSKVKTAFRSRYDD